MMRLLIPFVAALGVSLGASTGFVIMRAPAHTPVVAAKSSDSTAIAATPAAGAAGTDTAVAETPGPAAQTAAQGGHADSAQTTAAAPTAAQTPSVAPSPSRPAPPATTVVGAAASHESPTHEASTTHAQSLAPKVMTGRPDSAGMRIAKVFGAMQTRDAAHILQQMEDTDVRVILASLPAKQQAGILGQFPPQRAATLARATLRGTGEQQ